MEIKFKARAMTGEIVEGNYIHSKRFAGCSNEHRIHNQETGVESDIYPETLCRFVCNVNGEDLYEYDYFNNEGLVLAWCDRCMGWQWATADVPTKEIVINCHNCDGDFMFGDINLNYDIKKRGNLVL